MSNGNEKSAALDSAAEYRGVSDDEERGGSAQPRASRPGLLKRGAQLCLARFSGWLKAPESGKDRAGRAGWTVLVALFGLVVVATSPLLYGGILLVGSLGACAYYGRGGPPAPDAPEVDAPSPPVVAETAARPLPPMPAMPPAAHPEIRGHGEVETEAEGGVADDEEDVVPPDFWARNGPSALAESHGEVDAEPPVPPVVDLAKSRPLPRNPQVREVGQEAPLRDTDRDSGRDTDRDSGHNGTERAKLFTPPREQAGPLSFSEEKPQVSDAGHRVNLHKSDDGAEVTQGDKRPSRHAEQEEGGPWTEELEDLYRSLHLQGQSLRRLADMAGRGKSSVDRAIRRAEKRARKAEDERAAASSPPPPDDSAPSPRVLLPGGYAGEAGSEDCHVQRVRIANAAGASAPSTLAAEEAFTLIRAALMGDVSPGPAQWQVVVEGDGVSGALPHLGVTFEGAWTEVGEVLILSVEFNHNLQASLPEET